MKVLVCLMLWLGLSGPALGWTACGPLAFSAAAGAPSNINGLNWISVEYKTYFTAGSWSFPFTVPEGHYYYLTDILFQAKNVPGQLPSYFVLSSLFTVTSDIGHIHMRTPLVLPAGFILTGGFDNNTVHSTMNIIAIVNGVLSDSADCWQKWK